MTVQLEKGELSGEPQGAPPPQGHIGRVPYDLRRPTVSRYKARYWNPGDPHFFPPKVFGAGWGVNFFWLCHPLRYVKARRSER